MSERIRRRRFRDRFNLHVPHWLQECDLSPAGFIGYLVIRLEQINRRIQELAAHQGEPFSGLWGINKKPLSSFRTKEVSSQFPSDTPLAEDVHHAAILQNQIANVNRT